MVKVVVCVGSSCHIKGARKVVRRFQELIAERSLGKEVDLNGSFCMGLCAEPGVSVKVDGGQYFVQPDEADKFFMAEIAGRVSE